MKIFRFLTILALLFGSLAVQAGHHDNGKDQPFQPRFAMLRFNEVNMRTGPGTRYPIDWVYKRAGLPIEIIGNFDTWYRIRDFENSEGWVHQSAVRFIRRGMATGQLQAVRADPNAAAPITAHIEPGVIFDILSCTEEWCRVSGHDFKGYLRKSEFYGVYPSEVFD